MNIIGSDNQPTVELADINAHALHVAHISVLQEAQKAIGHIETLTHHSLKLDDIDDLKLIRNWLAVQGTGAKRILTTFNMEVGSDSSEAGVDSSTLSSHSSDEEEDFDSQDEDYKPPQ